MKSWSRIIVLIGIVSLPGITWSMGGRIAQAGKVGWRAMRPALRDSPTQLYQLGTYAKSRTPGAARSLFNQSFVPKATVIPQMSGFNWGQVPELNRQPFSLIGGTQPGKKATFSTDTLAVKTKRIRDMERAIKEGKKRVEQLLERAAGSDIVSAEMAELLIMADKADIKVDKYELLNIAARALHENPNVGPGALKALLDSPDIDVNRDNLLWEVAHSENIEIAKLLLETPGIDVNQGALAVAAHGGNVEMVKLLLASPGIDVNQGDPLTSAASRPGNIETVKLLLASPGIDVNQGDPLANAVLWGRRDMLKLLLEAPGIDVNHSEALAKAAKRTTNRDDSRYNFYESLLYARAAERDTNEMVKPLLNAMDDGALATFIEQNPKSEIKKQDILEVAGPETRAVVRRMTIDPHHGYNALHEAVDRGDADNVTRLLEQDPSLNTQQNFWGEIPLERAIEQGDADLVSTLLAFGPESLPKMSLLKKQDLKKNLEQMGDPKVESVMKSAQYGHSEIHTALENEDFETVKRMATQDPHLKYQENYWGDSIANIQARDDTHLSYSDELGYTSSLTNLGITQEEFEKGSPSISHLKQLNPDDRKKLECGLPEKLVPTFSKALKREHELIDSGYSVFYHGKKGSYGLLEDVVHGLLKETGHEEKAPDEFRYMQVHEPLLDPALDSVDDISKIIEQQHKRAIRKRLAEVQQKSMMEGRAPNEDLEAPNRLSVNVPLFANTSSAPGSCTWDFVARDTNIVNKSTPWQSNLQTMGVPQKVIDKYMPALELLEEQRKQAFVGGRLLQIAVPKDKVDELVYPSMGFGSKDSYRTTEGESLDKTSTVIEALEKGGLERRLIGNPDRTEFVMPLTPAALLNPESGVKIIPYDTATNEAAEREYDKAVQDIVKAMAEDIKASVAPQIKADSWQEIPASVAPETKENSSSPGIFENAMESWKNYWKPTGSSLPSLS